MTQRAADPSRWTYDEYARLPDDGDRYEVIRGEVCVTPGPRPMHQYVLAKLGRLLGDYVERHRLGVVLQEVDVLFATGEFLRPDLVYVPAGRLAGITTRGVEVAPALVVEVVSPGSERIDRVLKPPRYAELGVPEYWLANPEARVVEVFVPPDGMESAATLADTLEWRPDRGRGALRIDVPTLFAGW
jgi:Uma2 family endonuclease